MTNFRALRNKNPECVGCRYNVPQLQGGMGLNCNGRTMERDHNCPLWAVQMYLEKHDRQDTQDMIQSMKMKVGVKK